MKALSVMVLFLPFLLFAQTKKCADQVNENGFKWTTQARSQAGGWYFYLGKGIDKNYDYAFEKAEGLALSRLLKECPKIPLKTRFVERCVEKQGGHYTAYARANIEQKDCKKNIKKNKDLVRLHARYKKRMDRIRSNVCEIGNYKNCNLFGVLKWETSDLKKAIEYFQLGCKGGDGEACKNAGILFVQDKKLEIGFNYFQKSCYKNIFEACLSGGLLLNDSNKKNAISMLIKACDLGSGFGCVLAGADDFLPKEEKEKKLRKGCRLGNAESCQYLGNSYYEKGNKIKAHKAWRSICNQKNKNTKCEKMNFLTSMIKGNKKENFIRNQNLNVRMNWAIFVLE